MPSRPYCASRTARLAVVQAAGRPALDGVVLRHVGVEEQQRDAADVHPPDLEPEIGAEERDAQPERRPVGVRDPGHRQVVRLVREPVLLLPPAHVEPLTEVAAAVEEPDADHRQRLVARLLDDVARENAEPAGVEGHATRGSPNSAQKNATGPSMPGRGSSGRRRSAATSSASASIRAPRATGRARPRPASSARGRSGSAPGFARSAPSGNALMSRKSAAPSGCQLQR